MKLTSIRKALTLLSEFTDEDVFRMENTLIRWALMAESEISHPYKYSDAYQILELKNKRANIPYDCAIITKLLFGKYEKDEVDKVYMTKLRGMSMNLLSNSYNNFIGGQFYYWNDTGRNVLQPYDWTIQSDQIVFSPYVQDDYVTIKYKKQPTDDEGLPLVYENHIETISQYLKIRLIEQQEYNYIKTGKNIYQLRGLVQSLKMEYRKSLRYLKQPEFVDEQAYQEAISLFHDPLAGKGNVLLKNYK